MPDKGNEMRTMSAANAADNMEYCVASTICKNADNWTL